MKSVWQKMIAKKGGAKKDKPEVNGDQGRPGPAIASQHHQSCTPHPEQERTFGEQQDEPVTSATFSLSAKGVHPTDLSVLLSSPALNTPTLDALRNAIQIQPPPLCQVCRNLDASRAPSDRVGQSKSWIRWEYNIPQGTPVGKVTVSKPDTLLASAQRGCHFCHMVRCALDVADPSWHAKESFIYLFLAWGLPVVVRLHFGTTMAQDLSRDEATSALGMVVPEGQTINLSLDIVEEYPSPPIEVEIYRPLLNASQMTAGGTSTNLIT